MILPFWEGRLEKALKRGERREKAAENAEEGND